MFPPIGSSQSVPGSSLSHFRHVRCPLRPVRSRRVTVNVPHVGQLLRYSGLCLDDWHVFRLNSTIPLGARGAFPETGLVDLVRRTWVSPCSAMLVFGNSSMHGSYRG